MATTEVDPLPEDLAHPHRSRNWPVVIGVSAGAVFAALDVWLIVQALTMPWRG